MRVLFDQLTSGELPGPRALADQLGPAVEARDLQLWSTRPDEQALFARLGATGGVERTTGDSFGVITQNVNGNKIDWFLHRDISYDVSWDPESGEVNGTIEATIENQAPDSGLPASIIGWGGDESAGQRPVADGENFMLVALYSAYPIDNVTVDGEPMDVVPNEELGHYVARFFLSVPSKTTRRVAADVRGVVDPSARYVVRPIRQPMVNADQLEIRLSVSAGWNIEDRQRRNRRRWRQDRSDQGRRDQRRNRGRRRRRRRRPQGRARSPPRRVLIPPVSTHSGETRRGHAAPTNR